MRTKLLLLATVAGAALIVVLMSWPAEAFQEDPPPSLPEAELCALIDGSEPFMLRDYWSSCLDPGTGTYITDYQWTADSTDGYDPFDGSEQRGECPDSYNPCYDIEYFKQGGFGDESSVWLWNHRDGGPEAYSVGFRRDRFWVVVGDPDFLIPNVMSLSEAEAHAAEIDSRLGAWLAGSGGTTDSDNASVAVPDSPVNTPTVAATSPAPATQTSDDKNALLSPPVIAFGVAALAGGAWLVMQGTASAQPAIAAQMDAATNMAPTQAPRTQPPATQAPATQAPPAQAPPTQPSAAPPSPTSPQWWND